MSNFYSVADANRPRSEANYAIESTPITPPPIAARPVTVALGMLIDDDLRRSINLMRDAYLAATTEIERLTAERDSARTEVDVLRRTEAREIRELREQLDDARDKYGDKLCPRCSVEVAAEAAAEKQSTREGETP